MATVPRIIHQTWRTKEIPPVYHKWSQSWKDLHPDWDYRLWTDKCIDEFISDKFPWFYDVFIHYDKHIKRVDSWRYFLMYEIGGIYVDLDFECIRPLDSFCEQVKGVGLGRLQDGENFPDEIPNALMISKPGAKLWESVFDRLCQRAPQPRKVSYCTGPALLTDSVRAFGVDHPEILVADPDLFYPISWNTLDGQRRRREVLIDGVKYSRSALRSEFPRSLALTYWSHSWGSTFGDPDFLESR